MSCCAPGRERDKEIERKVLEEEFEDIIRQRERKKVKI